MERKKFHDMKTKLVALAGVFAAAVTFASATVVTGVTYDFEKASAEIFGRNASGSGANLLEGLKWSQSARISTDRIAKDDPRRALVRKAVKFSAEGGNRQVTVPDEVIGICGDENIARSIVGDWNVGVKLPDSDGGRYRLSFNYAMGHTLGEIGQAYVLIYSGDKAVGRMFEHLANIDSDDFSFTKDIPVPQGADRMIVIIRVDGVGFLRFWSPALMRSPPEKPVVLQHAAQGFFDRRFEISEGQPGLVSWLWKRGYGATYSNSDLRCVMTVPKGFTLEGVSFTDVDCAELKKTLADGSVEYRFWCAEWLKPKAAFSAWHRPGAMLTSSGGIGTRGKLTFRVETRGGETLSDTSEVDLEVVERISAPTPTRFTGGISPSGHDWLCGRKCDRLFAKFLADTGTAGLLTHTGDDAGHTKAYRDAGIREILRGDSELANGFCIGPGKERPEDEKYVFLEPGHMYAARSACPISIYTESEFFKSVTVPWLKRRTSGVDGFWTNWEPYSFAGKGCMCAECRAAFAKYVGVSDAEMAKDWPQELAFGRKWDGKIQKFRSLEHGKLVKTLAKYVNFIPGIAWCEMSSAWRPRNLAAEVQAIDYAGAVKTICPWGPYVHWDTTTPYAPGDGKCLVTFCAAKDVREWVNSDYPSATRPRLMGFPSGCSYGTDWVAEPEWIEVQQESFFFNGWASSYPSGFPRGYDARYWRAFARANAMAAKYEDFVYDGKRVDGDFLVEPSEGERLFKTKDNVSAYLDWTKKAVPLVQHVAYRRGSSEIVAIFNFSDKDDVKVDVVRRGEKLRKAVKIPACSCKVVE